MRYILVVVFSVFCTYGFSQYENLSHKSYAEKAQPMHAIFDEIITSNDSVGIVKEADKLRKFAKRTADKSLEFEIEIFELYVNSFLQHKSKKESVAAWKKLIDRAKREKIWHSELNATRALAEYYWNFIGNYELAFEQYFKLNNALKKIHPKDYPQMARDFNQIGESYYFFQDYDNAKRYFKKATQLTETEFNSKVISAAKNNLGLCYQLEADYDSSNYYFNKVLETKFPTSYEIWESIVKGNLGANYYKQGQLDLAIPLLKYDIKRALKYNDAGCVIGASTTLADIYLKKNQLDVSEKYILDAVKYIQLSGMIDRYLLLYPVMSKWYGAKGDSKKSQLYLDSALRETNKHYEKFNGLKILGAQQKITAQKNKLLQASFQLKNQKKTNERNVIILVSITLLVILILSYVLQKKRRKQMELEKLFVESKLSRSQQEVSRFIQKFNDQNKLIDSITSEIKQIKNTESEERKILEKTVNELRVSTILTDDDWIVFKQSFNSVYSTFTFNLVHSFPTVTEAEMRYLMLAKLQLCHKEMAHVLGISSDSVRVTWNRVRKKLGGTAEDTPQTILSKFE